MKTFVIKAQPGQIAGSTRRLIGRGRHGNPSSARHCRPSRAAPPPPARLHPGPRPPRPAPTPPARPRVKAGARVTRVRWLGSSNCRAGCFAAGLPSDEWWNCVMWLRWGAGKVTRPRSAPRPGLFRPAQLVWQPHQPRPALLSRLRPLIVLSRRHDGYPTFPARHDREAFCCHEGFLA